MRPYPLRVASDDRIAPVGWAVLRANYSRLKRYNWQQIGCNFQLTFYIASFASIYQVLTALYPDLEVMAKLHM